jgi:hypothetical protein
LDATLTLTEAQTFLLAQASESSTRAAPR